MQKKHRKLTEFTKKQSMEQVSEGAEQGERAPKAGSAEAAKGVNGESVIKEVFEILLQKQRQRAEVGQQPVSEVAGEKIVEKALAEEKCRDKPGLIQVERLVEVAQEAFQKKEFRYLECNKQGICADGRQLGEVFLDRGLRWQRTFLSTTRLPIFLDFVAEESVIRGRIGKAFIVVTERGAQAIIPEEFICEAAKRYGVLVNIDKCVNYRVFPWAEKSRRKQK